MHRLNRRDLGAALDCLRMTYATLDLEAFPRQAVAGLLRVVDAPFGSYNEIDHGATRIRYVVEPGDAQVPDLELVADQYRHEQPVLAHYLRTGDGSPHKLSDFVTPQQLHHLRIYNENYRRTGVEYQMTFMVKSLQRQSPPTIAIALDRSRAETDFTERDRLLLSLLRSHLMTAYANAETVSALRRTAPVAGGAPETRRREVVFLRRSGRHLISPRARYWLTLYFDDGPARGHPLPEDLQRWVREQATRLGCGNALTAPPRPLVMKREDTRLSIRLIPDSPDDLLVLEEERTKVDDTAPQQPGLTPREAEVLHWGGRRQNEQGHRDDSSDKSPHSGQTSRAGLLEAGRRDTNGCRRPRPRSPLRRAARRRESKLQTLPCSPHRVTLNPSEDLRKLDGWSGPAYRPSLVRFIYSAN